MYDMYDGYFTTNDYVTRLHFAECRVSVTHEWFLVVLRCRASPRQDLAGSSSDQAAATSQAGVLDGQVRPRAKPQQTHRLRSSSFLGLPYRILNMNQEKELLRSLWEAHSYRCRLCHM